MVSDGAWLNVSFLFLQFFSFFPFFSFFVVFFFYNFFYNFFLQPFYNFFTIFLQIFFFIFIFSIFFFHFFYLLHLLFPLLFRLLLFRHVLNSMQVVATRPSARQQASQPAPRSDATIQWGPAIVGVSWVHLPSGLSGPGDGASRVTSPSHVPSHV